MAETAHMHLNIVVHARDAIAYTKNAAEELARLRASVAESRLALKNSLNTINEARQMLIDAERLSRWGSALTD